MPQILKLTLHERMLSAAEQVFAEAGYSSATMASIAQRAGISTGNIYRYFDNKEALFSAILPDAFADAFRRLLKRRLAGLVDASDVTELDQEARVQADELLRFWIAHRLKVVIILDRAEGSRFADFGAEFVKDLLRATRTKLRKQHGVRQLSDPQELVLTNIFQNTRRSIVSILEAYEEEAQIRAAVAAFWSYQLAGLAGFTKGVIS
jgi:AcrR family transcriptional regulator